MVGADEFGVIEEVVVGLLLLVPLEGGFVCDFPNPTISKKLRK
jgi:hypothetical protein